MMTETLANRFQQSKGRPIRVGNETVFAIYEASVAAGRLLVRITREADKPAPTQGLRFKIQPGSFEVNKQTLSDIVLWADNSPDDVTLLVPTAKDAAIKIWNVWSVDDVMHAWTGNSGMLVEQTGRNLTLHCSDGTGEVCFSDLIASIEFNSIDA
ncbi:hypothetical protein [Trinickia sp. EG282A]|uniref:hypothetical protein n=1 Tax=Trinickia sp. EG282A TaxID=3237013 RepID=UPI0034D31F79